MDDKPVFNSSDNSGSVPPPKPSNEPLAAIPVQNANPNPWVPEEAVRAAGQSSPEFNPTPTSAPADVIQTGSFSDTPIPQENPFGAPSTTEEVYTPLVNDVPPPPPPPSGGRLSFLSLGSLIKILVGIVVVFLLFLFIFKVVPGFFNKGSDKITLTYWGLWEDSPTMQTVISDFERKNPNIKVEYSKQDIKQYREKLSTRIQNGTGPDIFALHSSWVPVFKTSLLPMSSDVISKDQFLKDFYPTAQKDLVKNGAIYAIPMEIDTLALYLNTQLLQAAGIPTPTNWQDFITASRQLTVKDETGKIQTAGAALGTFDNVTHAPDVISLLLVQNGANLADLASTPKQVNDALDFYTSFAKGEGNVWDATLDPSILAFEKGSLAMHFGYSWDYFAIKAANPNLEFSIVPVPHLPGQNQTVASYWAQGVSAKSTHQEQALLFMNFLAQKETEQKLYAEESKTRFFGEPYANVSLAVTLKDNPVVFPFVSQAPDAVSSYFAADTYDNAINSQMNTYLGNAVRSILNDTSPASATDTLTAGVSQVLSQYGK